MTTKSPRQTLEQREGEYIVSATGKADVEYRIQDKPAYSESSSTQPLHSKENNTIEKTTDQPKIEEEGRVSITPDF